jgi:hypothetical protein
MAKKLTKKRTVKIDKTHKLRTIKLILLLNTAILERLVEYVHNGTNKRSSISIIRSALKQFLDTVKFKYTSKELDEISRKIKFILISMVLAYGKPIKGSIKSKSSSKSSNNNILSGGGAYLAHLIDKGDKPITGNDFKKAMDDIAQILSPLMFAPGILEDFDVFTASTLLEIFKGDDDKAAAKGYFKWKLSDHYMSWFPPSIYTDKVWEVAKGAQNYLNVYFTHERLKKQALQEEGKLSEADLQPSALEKMAQELFEKKMELDMTLINPTKLNKFNPTMFLKANL